MEYYDIRNIDVSKLLIKMALEASEENISEWFEGQPYNYFVNNIISQVGNVAIDEIVLEDHPLKRKPIVDPHDRVLTYYIVFHGEDVSFGDDFEEAMAYVSVLVNANTGEAYAVKSEKV